MILHRSERCANKDLGFWRLVAAVQSRHPIAHLFRHRTLSTFPWHEGNDAVNTPMVQTNRNKMITPTPHQRHAWRIHNKFRLYQCSMKRMMACPACIVVHSCVHSAPSLPKTNFHPRNSIPSCGSAFLTEASKSPATSGGSPLPHACRYECSQ